MCLSSGTVLHVHKNTCPQLIPLLFTCPPDHFISSLIVYDALVQWDGSRPLYCDWTPSTQMLLIPVFVAAWRGHREWASVFCDCVLMCLAVLGPEGSGGHAGAVVVGCWRFSVELAIEAQPAMSNDIPQWRQAWLCGPAPVWPGNECWQPRWTVNAGDPLEVRERVARWWCHRSARVAPKVWERARRKELHSKL